METWPVAKFGAPLYDEFGFGNRAAVERTPMDSSRIRKRKLATVNRKVIPVIFNFDDETLAAFQAWHEFKVNLGVDDFTMYGNLGDGEKTYTVNMGGNYQADHVDGRWQVQITLEILNPIIMTEAALDTWLAS